MSVSHSDGEATQIAVRVIDRTRYDRVTRFVAPTDQESDGFLDGSPADNRICRVTGSDALTHRAFFILEGSTGPAFVEAVEPMTVPEWRRLTDIIFKIVA